MTYEETPVKKSKLDPKKLALKELERVGTGSIIWYLVKRHKTGLLATWAVLMTALYMFPPLPDVLFGLLGH